MGPKKTRTPPVNSPLPRELISTFFQLTHPPSPIKVPISHPRDSVPSNKKTEASHSSNPATRQRQRHKEIKRHSAVYHTAPTRRFKAHQQNGLLRLELQVLRTTPPPPARRERAPKISSSHVTHPIPPPRRAGNSPVRHPCHPTPSLLDHAIGGKKRIN